MHANAPGGTLRMPSVASGAAGAAGRDANGAAAAGGMAATFALTRAPRSETAKRRSNRATHPSPIAVTARRCAITAASSPTCAWL